MFITEEMRGNFDFSYKFDSLNKDKFIPRNFVIKRLSNFDYKFYIRNSYVGYIPNGGPIAGQECIEVYPNIIPHKGYVLDAYWLDKPITSLEKTNIVRNTFGIEMTN